MGETVPFTLPTCGGKVWLRTRLTRGQAKQLRKGMAKLVTEIPEEAVALLAQARAETGPGEKVDLSATGLFGILDASQDMETVVIGVMVSRWANVTDPDGAELTFPDDIERLDEEDFDALYREAERIRRESAPNPQPGSEPSSSESSAESRSPTTPLTT